MTKIKFYSCDTPTKQHGVFIIFTAISMVALLGFAALGVDVAYIIYNQKRLESATDAAALAGGEDLWSQSWSTAKGNATLYSAAYPSAANATGGGGGTGNYIALTNGVTVNAPTITGLKLNTVALPYAQAVSGYNAIQVTQTATVPLFFAPVLGFRTVNISATSTGSAGGGVSQPLNVEIVLDTTQSMSKTNDPNCGNVSKLQCALNGAKTLINQLSAAGDNIGLVVFPPLASQASVTADASCNSSSGVTVQNYMAGTGANLWADTATSISTIVALTNSTTGSTPYMSNGKPNTASPLMNAFGVGPSGKSCTGLAAPGGVGTYFAQAIYQAQANLAALSAVNKEQNAMIVLSDGDASSSNVNGTAYDNNQCQQAIVAANAAKTAKTWVYVIAYQSPTSGGCSTDNSSTLSPLVNGKGIQPCATLQWISGNTASNTAPGTPPSYFYSDSSTCTSKNSISSVSTLFGLVGNTLAGSRLIPKNAQ